MGQWKGTFSEKKRAASMRALEIANEKNRQKVFGIWRCKTCQKERRATVHQMRHTYCSKDCMSKDYSVILAGSNNPHYSNAGRRVCEVCLIEFQSYQPGRRFCGIECRDRNNHLLDPGTRKDANHNEIVNAFTVGGALVLDLTNTAYGVPDLAVSYGNAWHLVEIKNPRTYYGRLGLNARQRQWAENWKGGPVFVVKSLTDVENFLAFQFDLIEQVGGGGLLVCSK